MQAGEFLKKVRVRSGLHDNDSAMQAIQAVFDTLKARIQLDSAHNLASQLPHEIKEMLEPRTAEKLTRPVVGIDRMDLPEFLERVQDKGRYANLDQAETITHAVLATMREQLTPGAQEELLGQLPEDLRNFAIASVPQDEVVPMEPEVAMAGRRGGSTVAVGPELDVPTGADLTAPTTMGAPKQKAKVGPDVSPMTPEVQELESPAAQAIEKGVEAMPPGEYSERDREGPGSSEHYRSDKQLEMEVRRLLDTNEEIDASKIDVTVQAGNVTLKGHLRSEDEIEKATQLACSAVAIGGVCADLDVED